RYRNLQFIGEGGMARVYCAFDPVLKRQVAIKQLRVNDPELKTRLLKEAQAQGRIVDPHICRVYEAGEIGGVPFIAMQYIAGKSLKEMMRQLSLPQKVELIRQVADALHAAHRLGFVHRDIKPANILVQPAEEFGLVAYV